MMDPIADMLTRIRNAQAVRKTEVSLAHSKLKQRIAEILVTEGYLGALEELELDGRKHLKLKLKYSGKRPVIQMLRRVSKPGRRVYVASQHLPYVYDNMGIAIISTSRGMMTNKEARKQKIGGEVICEIF